MNDILGRIGDRPELTVLIAKAQAAYEALSPEERESHDKAQRESFVRGNVELDRMERAERRTRRNPAPDLIPIVALPPKAVNAPGPREQAITVLRAKLAEVDTAAEQLRLKRITINETIYQLARGAISPAAAIEVAK